MEEKQMICTACPMGCMLLVSLENGAVSRVSGNRCKRGDTYGRQEAVDPQRMVASTVSVPNGFHPLLPVYTSKMVSKKRIPEVLALLKGVQLQAPIKAGTVVLHGIMGTDVDIIASRDMPVKKH